MEITPFEYSIGMCSKIQGICEPLLTSSPIKYFAFSRVFDEGVAVDFTTSAEWNKYFYENELHSITAAPRMVVGFNFLSRSKNKEVNHLERVAAEDFDIANKVDFVSRHNGFFDVYTFASSKKLYSKASHYYTYHQDILLKFIAYIQKYYQESLVAEGKDHSIALNNYKCPLYKIKRDYPAEMLSKDHDLSLTSCEFICLLLYASGCTAKQVASITARSVSTIETHLTNIKEKICVRDRKSMNAYIREHNFDRLIDFFFNYV